MELRSFKIEGNSKFARQQQKAMDTARYAALRMTLERAEKFLENCQRDLQIIGSNRSPELSRAAISIYTNLLLVGFRQVDQLPVDKLPNGGVILSYLKRPDEQRNRGQGSSKDAGRSSGVDDLLGRVLEGVTWRKLKEVWQERKQELDI